MGGGGSISSRVCKSSREHPSVHHAQPSSLWIPSPLTAVTQPFLRRAWPCPTQVLETQKSGAVQWFPAMQKEDTSSQGLQGSKGSGPSSLASFCMPCPLALSLQPHWPPFGCRPHLLLPNTCLCACCSSKLVPIRSPVDRSIPGPLWYLLQLQFYSYLCDYLTKG